jgi:hypothetical protein
MNKFLLAALLMLGMATPVLADFSREDSNPAGFVNMAGAYTAVDAAVVARPALVYGITAYADAANTHCDVYDASTTPANGVKPKIEVGEATQYRTTRYTYDPPLKFTTGVYVDAAAGSCHIEYR